MAIAVAEWFIQSNVTGSFIPLYKGFFKLPNEQKGVK